MQTESAWLTFFRLMRRIFFASRLVSMAIISLVNVQTSSEPSWIYNVGSNIAVLLFRAKYYGVQCVGLRSV